MRDFAAGAAFVSAIAMATPALACTCKALSRAQILAQTPIVFEGRVLRVRTEKDTLYADIEMIRPIKGSIPRVVEVGTPASGPACGYPFKPGQRLTVGVHFKEQQFTTNSCLMHPLNAGR